MRQNGKILVQVMHLARFECEKKQAMLGVCTPDKGEDTVSE